VFFCVTVYIPQRYLLSLMGFFAIVNAYTMRVCLNVAITVMVKKNTSSHHVDPDACPAEEAPAGYIVHVSIHLINWRID
jgi:hypothetical protein